MTLHRILVPTDFSDAAHAAAHLGYAIARRVGADLNVHHACQPSEWAGDVMDPEYEPEDFWTRLWGRRLQLIERRLEELHWQLRDSPETDVTITGTHSRGEVVSQIVTTAKRSSADLIVMGAKGASGSLRYLFGGVSAKVSRHSPCPLLIVRNVSPASRHPGAFKRILVAVDYSPVSAALVQQIENFAAEGASIRILHVCEVPTFLDTDTEFADAIEDLHRSELDRMKAFLVDNDLAPGDFDKFVDIGSVVHQVLERSEEHRADLIIVGSHSRTGVERIVGTVADRVMRNASCCVLLVPRTTPAPGT